MGIGFAFLIMFAAFTIGFLLMKKVDLFIYTVELAKYNKPDNPTNQSKSDKPERTE